MIVPSSIEWDEEKALANEAKHGLSFITAAGVFFDPAHITIETIRPQDGEDRTKIVGLIEGRLFTVVFTMRGQVCRIISARRSNRSEERNYGNRPIQS